jgi:HlyD family secretion protein
MYSCRERAAVKIAITAIVSCVVTAVVLGVFLSRGSSHGNADPATSVRLENPVRGELVEMVSVPGEVEPLTKVSISARVSARILDIPFREGKSVTRGNPNANPPIAPSVLVRLDDTDLKATLRSAKSRRDAQTAQLEVARARIFAQQASIEGLRASCLDAERNLAREKELFKSKYTSQATLDQTQCQVDKDKADLANAERSLNADQKNLLALQHTLQSLEAEVVRCQDNLTYTEIVSPIDGIVTRVKAEVGEVAMMGTMNNAGTELLQVADLDNMLVVAQVDESDVGSVQVGQKAKIHMQTYPDKIFEGTVKSVALVQTPPSMGKAKYYETRVLLKTDGQRIFSGLTADVDIEIHRHANVLKIPSQAVLGRRVDDLPVKIRDLPEVEKTKAETAVVYRCVDGKAVVTPVKIGPVDATHSVILSGLSESDKVIVGPYKVLQNLRHEQSVADERSQDKDKQGKSDSQPPTAATKEAATSQATK